MRNRVVHAALLYICAVVAASCSAYRDYQDRQPAAVWKIESMLENAGFHRIWISTPAESGAAAQLPMYRLNRYQSASGSVYWYADPKYCGCLFEGDQAAYDRYAMLMQQERDTAQYVDDYDEQQLAMLSPFGYAMPPPLLLGGWPVYYGPRAFGGGGGGGGGRGGAGGGGGGGSPHYGVGAPHHPIVGPVGGGSPVGLPPTGAGGTGGGGGSHGGGPGGVFGGGGSLGGGSGGGGGHSGGGGGGSGHHGGGGHGH